jgi:hypothetical protein
MQEQIVPDEVFDLIEKQTSSFKSFFTPKYLLENYKYGPSDILVFFDKGKLGIVGNGELYKEKMIVNVRANMIAQLMNMAQQKHPEIVNNLNLVVPFCFSDKSDTPINQIPCLSFSKAEFSNNIVIPSIDNYCAVEPTFLQRVDQYDISLSQKENRMCFFGSWTGNVGDKVSDNPRLLLAAQATKSDNIVCRLSRPPMFPEDSFLASIKRANELYPELNNEIILNTGETVDISEQLKYKYQLCVDGHTSAWSRLPWQMYSNSIPIKVRNRKTSWVEWFYPLLDFSKHCIEADVEDLQEVYESLENNKQLQEDIVYSGKQFVQKYWNQNLAMDVLVQTLYLLNQIQNRT